MAVDGKQYAEIERLAREHANRIAPPPPFDPQGAGIAAAVGAALVIGLFAGLMQLSLEAIGLPLLIVMIVVYAAVALYLSRLQSKNSLAFVRRVRELEEARANRT